MNGAAALQQHTAQTTAREEQEALAQAMATAADELAERAKALRFGPPLASALDLKKLHNELLDHKNRVDAMALRTQRLVRLANLQQR